MKDRIEQTLEELRPAVPSDSGSQRIFAAQLRLAKSQWAAPAEIEAYQLARLKTLVAFAVREAPFWREGIAADDVAAAPTLNEALGALPILSRAALRDNRERLRAETLPSGHRPAGQRSSSGSTGMVVAVDTTNVALDWQNALAFRAQLWAGRDLQRGIAVIRRYPKGPTAWPDGLKVPYWAPPSVFPFPTGPSFHLTTLNTSIEQQWDWLARIAPSYLMTYPSIVRALAMRAHQMGHAPAALKGITTVGEVVDSELRELALRHLGAPVSDIYSSEEAGTMALQCPACALYHVQAEVLIVEILDERGMPCGPGDTGRVVVTPLYNCAMPLLRYDIGDFAEVGPSCGCGRGLPVLARILGRRRNMLILPDGRLYWPSFGARALQSIVPMREHQFRQIGPNIIEALLVVEGPVSAAQEAEMRAIIAAGLPVPFDIQIRCVAEIPRPASGKHEEFVSMLG